MYCRFKIFAYICRVIKQQQKPTKMAAHRINPKTGKPLCQKRFGSIVSQNYEIVTEETFFKIAKEQPEYACKKCANIANKNQTKSTTK